MSASARPPAGAAAWRQYLCRVCGLVYDEALGDADSGLAPGTRFDDIPDDWACPICGVGKADFEPYTPSDASTAAAGAMAAAAGAVPSPRAPGVVVVGAGRAGWQVVQALRAQGCTAPITVVAACSGDVYDKPQLSVAVARGLPLPGLVLETAAQAARRWGVRLLCDTHAVAIDAPRQRLRTTRGSLRYAHLVLAHGAEPALPAELPPGRVWRVNDLASYQRLRARLDGAPQRLAIVGAGLVGCELANDLALAGHHITLLDLQPQPLSAQLPPPVGQRLLAAWAALPIRFVGGARVTGVLPPQDGQPGWRLALADGQELLVDQVIAATGLRAPGRLATSAGLQFDALAGGIAVDAGCATSQPNIHALGDCAVVAGRASRYIEPIARQAVAIAARILGGLDGGVGDADGAELGSAVSAAQGCPPGPQAAAAGIGEPVLRVKTSTLPITLTRHAAGAGTWQVLSDGPDALRLQLRSADGRALASVVAALVSLRH